MITLKLMISIMLLAATIGWAVDYAFAETRTLTTTLMITVKAPDTRQAQSPMGMQDIYNSALVQSQANRLVKVEEAMHTPAGIPRYTMSEKL